MEELLLNKIGALAIMLILAMIAGLSPMKLRSLLIQRSGISEKYTMIIISASLCFGAGVLMATVFLHILKETREKLDEAMNLGFIKKTEYPLAELITCCGFFLIYFLEELVHLWVHHQNDLGSDIEGSAEHYHFRRASSLSLRGSRRQRRCSVGSVSALTGCESITFPKQSDKIGNEIRQINASTLTTGKTSPEVYAVENNSFHEKIDNLQPSNSAHQQVSSTNNESFSELYLIRSVLVILALSIHGTFEGISLGLEDKIHDVWLLFVALSAHKIFIAFSIGMELLEVGVAKLIYVLHMIVFSLASPIGGLIGTTLSASIDSENEAGKMSIAVLQGISGGTILYVTFCEVLERERCKANGRFIRLIALMVGFAVMAGLEASGLHSHHSDDIVPDNATTPFYNLIEAGNHYHGNH